MTDIQNILQIPKSPNDFSIMIEKRKVAETTYIQTIVDYCEEMDCEPADIKTLINKSLTEKIRDEAIELKMINDRPVVKLPL